MPNPKLETYKNKATGTVYDYTDAAAQAALADILDGTDIDSFGDVETALAEKVDKVAGKGLSTNDYDDTEKAKVAGAFPRSEQAVLGAKNVFDYVNTPTYAYNASKTFITNGVKVQTTQATKYGNIYYAIPNIFKNKDMKFRFSVDYISGVAGILIRESDVINTEGATVASRLEITQDTEVTLTFNTGTKNYLILQLFASYNTSETGEVDYTNMMMWLASDSDPTFAPYAMTNKELTEKVGNNVYTGFAQGTTIQDMITTIINDYISNHNFVNGDTRTVACGITSVGYFAVNMTYTTNRVQGYVLNEANHLYIYHYNINNQTLDIKEATLTAVS